MRLPRLFVRERIVTIQQFLDKDRNPHIYVVTPKRIVELDYETQKERKVVATLQDIKKAKKVGDS